MFAQHHDCWWVFTPLLIVEAGNVQCHRSFFVVVVVAASVCVCRINYKPVIVCRRIFGEVKKNRHKSSPKCQTNKTIKIDIN